MFKQNLNYRIYKVNLDQAGIAKISKVGNGLEIELLKTVEKIVIDDFFTGDHSKELVLETANEQYFLIGLQEFDTTGIATKVGYLGIDDFQDYLTGD